MSPTMSTVTPAHPQRRLSARRGSLTAADPYALHADINETPDRTSSSKLTIVRVLPQQTNSPPITLNDPPSSFTSVSRRRSYRLGPTSPPDTPPPGRLSFAFSSFGSGDGSGHHREGSTGSIGGGPSSPSSSPRLRPIGPNQSPRLSVSGGPSYGHSKPRLTPEQLVDLARQATSPRTLAQIASGTPSGGPDSSPGVQPGSPVLRSNSPAFGTPGVVAPATFTPLPDDIYLPFIDRPYEVAQLISTPPDAKLFNLLAQTLPKTYDGPLPSPSPSADTIQLPLDPARWTYTHLHAHLTQVDRDIDSDAVWVAKARKCILSHSELIWERAKGCFGVPPDLDHLDWDWEKEERMKARLSALEEGRKKRTSSGDKQQERMRRLRAEIREGAPRHGIRGGKVVSGGKLDGGDSTGWAAESALDSEDEGEAVAPPVKSPSLSVNPPDTAVTVATEEVSPDEGKVPGGHWSDWDDTVDSPVYAKGELPSIDAERSNSIEIVSESPSAPSDDEGDSLGGDFIEIEALVAPSDPSSGSSPNPPPLSLGGSMVVGNPELSEGNLLGDIAEGEEEEEETEAKEPAQDAENKGTFVTQQESQEEDLIPPSQIQGLRISTVPVHASGSYGVGGVFVPNHSHLHPTLSPGKPPSEPGANDPIAVPGHSRHGSLSGGASIPNDSATGGTSLQLTRTHSRTSSFSSVNGVTIGPFSRSESTGNLNALMAAATSLNHYSGSEAGDSAGYISDSVTNSNRNSDALGDRLPGQPLFVSNFARLNGVPTLSHHPYSASHTHTGTVSPPGSSSHSGKIRVKRTGSTSGLLGTVPSSSFIGNKGSSVGFHGGADLARTNSQGSLSGRIFR